MKMAKWALVDVQKGKTGQVYVLKGESPDQATPKTVYNGKHAKFHLLYNTQMRMIGYLLDYNYKKKYPKRSLFNFFGIIYNPHPVKEENINFEILYEDQVLRLLAYDHPNRTRDYILVGRWREETDLANEVVEEL